MFYAFYRSSCFFFEMTNMENFFATACWWPCCYLRCASSLRTQERTWVFWEAFNFLRWCSNLFRTKRRKLDTLHLIFIVLINTVGILNIGLYISPVDQVLSWNYLVIYLYWNVCNWVPKLIRARRVWFRKFFWWTVLRFVVIMSAWTEVPKNCSIMFLFSRHEVFSISSLRSNLEIHKPKLRKPKKTKVPK